MLIGYMQVSTDDQNIELQRDALFREGFLPKTSIPISAVVKRPTAPGLASAFPTSLKSLRDSTASTSISGFSRVGEA